MAKRTLRSPSGPLRVVFYMRVSTEEQVSSGAGLAAQEAALLAEAARRSWQVVRTVTDAAASGKTMSGRPALAEALRMVASGEADALAVARLDRLSRSVLDFATLLDRSQREGWSLVALDMAVDTTTAAGEAMAHIVATFAQMERRLIGERTRAALATKRAAGVRLGRPRTLPLDVVRRIVRERAEASTLQAIANGLRRDGVPTAHGGQWRPGTVAAVLRSQDAQAA
jgi:DNA invertase Pin-like site-specific DNA recombinase